MTANYLSLGAGVQSSAMALMAAHGEITPMPDAAIFADTQAEPASVYRWLDWLEPRLPYPVHRVTAGSLWDSALEPHVSRKGITYYRTAIPFFTRNEDDSQGRISHRTCTRDFKIKPILKRVREEVGSKKIREWRKRHKDNLDAWKAYEASQKAQRAAKRNRSNPPPAIAFPTEEWEAMQRDALAVQWIGISTDEIERVKPSRDPWIVNRHPLIELRKTRLACLDWLRSRGYPEPPRSACVFCPFRTNREWRRLRNDDPEGFQQAIEFDHTARSVRRGTNLRSEVFVHRSLVPLTEVNLQSDEDRGQLTFWSEECEGICGV